MSLDDKFDSAKLENYYPVVDWIDNYVKKIKDYSVEITQVKAKLNEALSTNNFANEVKDKASSGGSISVALDISTKKNTLVEKARALLLGAQEELQSTPLEVEISFVSGYQTKKNNKLLRDIQANVAQMSNEELAEAYGSLASGNVETVVESAIKAIQKRLNENPVKLQLDADLTEGSKTVIKNELNALSEDIDFSIGKKGSITVTQEVKDNLQNVWEFFQKINSEDFSFAGNANAELASVKQSLEGIINLLHEISNTHFNNIEQLIAPMNEVGRILRTAFNLPSLDELDSQFAGIQKRLQSLSDLNGGARLTSGNQYTSQLKAIAEEFQNYLKIGGQSSVKELFSNLNVTDNIRKNFKNSLKQLSNIESTPVEVGIEFDIKESLNKLRSEIESMPPLEIPSSMGVSDDGNFNGLYRSLDKIADKSGDIVIGLNRIASANRDLSQSAMDAVDSLGIEQQTLNLISKIVKEYNRGKGTQKTSLPIEETNISASQAQAEINKWNNAITKANKRNEKQGTGFTSAFQTELDNTTKLIDKAQKLIDDFWENLKQDPDAEFNSTAFDELKEAIEGSKTLEGLDMPKNIGATTSQLDTLYSKITNFYNNNGRPKALEGIISELKELSAEAKKTGASYTDSLSKVGLKDLDADAKAIEGRLRETGKAAKNFSQQIGSALTSKLSQSFAMWFSFFDVIRYVRQLVDNIKQIDSALVELQKVSDATNSQIQQSFQNSTKIAKEYGTTITDVIASISDWARMGYSIPDSEELARVTTLMQNVSEDSTTQEDASSYLVSSLQGFEMAVDEVEKIADVYNEVANNFAIDKLMCL